MFQERIREFEGSGKGLGIPGFGLGYNIEANILPLF